MRIIFFAGKGGVGKTSVAAATGMATSARGCRTLIMSLDVAHSLADIFDLERGLLDQHRGRPVKVRPNLWIQELDIQEEIDRNWGEIHRYLSGLLNTTGLNEVLAEELAVLPGMEEVSLLLYINRYTRERRFDALLLDCAPTGESLRFISIPTTLEWYMKKIFKLERTIVRCARPLAKRLTDVPLPGEEYFTAVERLFLRLEGVDRILSDPALTTVRLVTNPEKVVIKETQRAFMYFCLYRMSIDAVIMNRMLPSGIRDGFFSDWLYSQSRYAELARTYFHPVPVFPVNLFQGEILGPERLAALAAEIYGERDPLQRFYEEEPYRLIKEEGRYRLQLKLPFVVKESIDLSKVADELILRIGSYKRHILLPKPLVATSSVTARVDPPYLNILFGGDGS
ncbi:MAG: TRC40/GET3/ArsA family transport-energizing ATPase [Desulfobacterales bacterium]|nr:TRC40/GET3/ArsA family transport-energizing ATPase [Desulfobacterales bacterium]